MSDETGQPGTPGLTASYPYFQGPIDKALRKRDPDVSIPWGPAAPAWAEGFRPRVIADLGSAQGVFTAAALTRLGQWGCLARLERLVLVEEEPGFGTTSSGRRALAEDCAKVARAYGAAGVAVELENCAASPPPPDAADPRVLLADGKPLDADLIIASHVTYYFDDGGRRFLAAAAATVARHCGLVWVIARKHDCPVYRTRESRDWDRPFAQAAIDFAEPLEAALRAEGRVRIIDALDCTYLDEGSRPGNCPQIAQLLGWRLVDTNPGGAIARTAVALCEQPGPLFAERHLIIR